VAFCCCHRHHHPQSADDSASSQQDRDDEAAEFIDDDLLVFPSTDEEFLHASNMSMSSRLSSSSPFAGRSRVNRVARLDPVEVEWARQQRVRHLRISALFRQLVFDLVFLVSLLFFTHASLNPQAYDQVAHFRHFFLRSSPSLSPSISTTVNFEQINTIDQYWTWLDTIFLNKIRAQTWYNGQAPRNLSGYLDDKTNRLLGWPILRQLRVSNHSCPPSTRTLILTADQQHPPCVFDYSFFDEERRHFESNWTLPSSSSSSSSSFNSSTLNHSTTTRKAFQYEDNERLRTQVYWAPHHSYDSGGYVYEFRGRLRELRSNLSQLHRLQWIDRQTRALFLQMTVYNPNVQLFTSILLLVEQLPTGGLFAHHRFEPISFAGRIQS
jgi:hypothetical protein